jgi:hypothetical protein
VAAWVPDMLYAFYFVKNHKIAKNSTTPKAREKIRQIWNPQNFRNFLMAVPLNLKTIQFNLSRLYIGDV